jgi:hypothetical protein
VADDRSDFSSDSGAAAQPGGGRKAKPPVIELTATDVTPEQPKPKTEEETPQAEQKARAETPRNPEPAAPPPHHRHPMIFSVLAGVIGLLAGALALSLVMLFAGEGAKLPATSLPQAGPSAAVPDTALRERTDGLAKAHGEVEKRTGELEAKVKELDLAPLKSRLESLETALKDLRGFAEQAQTSGSVTSAALLERLGAIEAQVKKAASRPAVANAAEVAALGALRDAIAKGAPFMKELDAVRKMLGDAAAPLAPLEASAASGLPTVTELRRRFSDLAPKLASAPPPDSGYFAKLWSNATKLIEVRPVGEVAGTSAGAVVARIETRLARNDLAAALDEAAQLPPSAKAQAADWISAASRRREADTIVKNLMDAALANAATGTLK